MVSSSRRWEHNEKLYENFRNKYSSFERAKEQSDQPELVGRIERCYNFTNEAFSIWAEYGELNIEYINCLTDACAIKMQEDTVEDILGIHPTCVYWAIKPPIYAEEVTLRFYALKHRTDLLFETFMNMTDSLSGILTKGTTMEDLEKARIPLKSAIDIVTNSLNFQISPALTAAIDSELNETARADLTRIYHDEYCRIISLYIDICKELILNLKESIERLLVSP